MAQHVCGLSPVLLTGPDRHWPVSDTLCSAASREALTDDDSLRMHPPWLTLGVKATSCLEVTVLGTGYVTGTVSHTVGCSLATKEHVEGLTHRKSPTRVNHSVSFV